ncbi:hypothetical protein DFJ74DRAFT_712041 [Hyaloraphidium curvatum]|nr:hypothetical protein DFJ74DRAFT_712041 [Hyaloraphidium curvatum]
MAGESSGDAFPAVSTSLPDAVFSPPEWLALFPSALPPPTRISSPSWRLTPANDPAADLREARPLTAAAMLGAFAPYAGLHAVVKWFFLLLPVTSHRAPWPFVAAETGLVVLAVALCLFGAGEFTAASLAVGILPVVSSWAIMIYRFVRSRYTMVSPKRGGRSADFSSHPFAGMARWLQLVRPAEGELDGREVVGTAPDVAAVGASNGTKGAVLHIGLVSHVDGDPHCPCVVCAEDLPGLAGHLRILEHVARSIMNFAYALFMLPALFSFPTRVWTTWWTAVAAALGIIGFATGCIIYIGVRIPINVAALELEGRLHRRALRIALRDLLDWYAAALNSPVDGTEMRIKPAAEEVYVILYSMLVAGWRNRFPSLLTGIGFLGLNMVLPIVAAIATMIAGSCVPIWIIVILVTCFMLLLIDLVNHAASNAQIAASTELLRLARAEVHRLLVSSPAGHPARPALEQHAGLMAAFGDAAGLGARFGGVVIDYGVVRTVGATVFTVGLGLWSLLRGASIFFETTMALRGPAVVVLLVLALVPLGALAQQTAGTGTTGTGTTFAPTFSTPTTTTADTGTLVRVSASATATARPDRAILLIEVSTTNRTAQDASNTNAALSSRVSASVNSTLSSLAPGSTLETLSISLSPVYNYSNTPPVLVGFQASQIFKTTFDASPADLGRAVGAAIDAAVSSGATGLRGILFTVRDPAALEATALALAARRAATEADVLAGALGRSVKRIISVDETGGGGATPVPTEVAAASPGAGGTGAGGTQVVPRAVEAVSSVSLEAEVS